MQNGIYLDMYLFLYLHIVAAAVVYALFFTFLFSLEFMQFKLIDIEGLLQPCIGNLSALNFWNPDEEGLESRICSLSILQKMKIKM